MGEKRVDVVGEEERRHVTSEAKKSRRENHVDAAMDLGISRLVSLDMDILLNDHNVQACLPRHLRIFASQTRHYLRPIAMRHDRKRHSSSRPRRP